MFIVILGTVLGLMHLYMWKRLVKDTGAGRTRWALTAVFVALLVLLCRTLLLPRLFGWREPAWLAWPGYVWFGLVVYCSSPCWWSSRSDLRCAVGDTQSHQTARRPTGAAMNRRVFLARASAVAAGAASVGLVGVGWPMRSVRPTC